MASAGRSFELCYHESTRLLSPCDSPRCAGKQRRAYLLRISLPIISTNVKSIRFQWSGQQVQVTVVSMLSNPFQLITLLFGRPSTVTQFLGVLSGKSYMPQGDVIRCVCPNLQDYCDLMFPDRAIFYSHRAYSPCPILAAPQIHPQVRHPPCRNSYSLLYGVALNSFCVFWRTTFIGTLGYLSVGINSSIFTTFCLALYSQYYLRKHHPRWFRKYNFLLSAALDGGTQVRCPNVFPKISSLSNDPGHGIRLHVCCRRG